MKIKKIYLVPTIFTEIPIKMGSGFEWVVNASLENVYQSGNFGMMAVFTNKRKAKKFAGKNREVIEIRNTAK